MEMEKKMLDLPDEVLLVIFSFVPNRFKASQVCHKFYELVCEIDKNKFVMKIKPDENGVSLYGIILQNIINDFFPLFLVIF